MSIPLGMRRIVLWSCHPVSVRKSANAAGPPGMPNPISYLGTYFVSFLFCYCLGDLLACASVASLCCFCLGAGLGALLASVACASVTSVCCFCSGRSWRSIHGGRQTRYLPLALSTYIFIYISALARISFSSLSSINT